MTRHAIERRADGIRVGAAPAGIERTAVLECRGALVVWDALADAAEPSIVIWDADLAAEWLWEVIGADAWAAIDAGATECDLVPGPSTAAARRAARAAWALDWWPASFTAGLPDIDPALAGAELALALDEIEHLLDDDDEAVERAIRTVLPFLDAPRDARGPDADDALLDELRDLADERGIATVEAASPLRRSDVALAATALGQGGPSLATGTVPVAPAALAPATLDAGGVAVWRLVQRDGALVVELEAPRAPDRFGRCPAAPLVAEVDGVAFELRRHETTFAGSAPAAPTMLTTPADRRVVRIASHGYEPGETPSADDRAALLAAARARLDAVDATPWEREAAGRRFP